ncbi:MULTISPECIES: hypothetical protein [unclassified Nocardia]
MASCETTHWTLDCGEGHGCYLSEYSDTGELAGWGCNSEPVKGRPRRKADEPSFVDGAREIEFCCNNITRAALAEALDDLFEAEIIVPKGSHRELINQCTTATIGQIIREVGLSVRE